MNCARARSHLGDHLEGDLDLQTRTRVDEHLGRCASCARELSELRSTVGLLRSLPAPQPPAELANEVMRRIGAGEGSARQSPALIRNLFSPRIAAALAAVLAGFAIFTSVETSWVRTTTTITDAPIEIAGADEKAIAMWKDSPPTLAKNKAVQPRLAAIERAAAKRFYLAKNKAVQPRLAAIERAAAKRFYRADLRSTGVGIYGRVDPDLQQLDLDGQLDRAMLNPNDFIRQVDQIAESERRTTIAPLVVRASRRGDAQAVARRLRATSHPLANRLAAEFDRNRSKPVGTARAIQASY